MKQKALQQDIASELESLTFNELGQIAMLINEFYSKSNGKPTIVIKGQKTRFKTFLGGIFILPSVFIPRNYRVLLMKLGN